MNKQAVCLAGVLCGAAVLSATAVLSAQGRHPEGTPQIVGVTSFERFGVHHAVAWSMGQDGRLRVAARGSIGGVGTAADLQTDNHEHIDTPSLSPVSPTEAEIFVEAARQQQALAGIENDLNAEVTRMSICASSPIPDGWIKVDDFWSPTTCGNPGNITYNVWVIERYSNKPRGAVMDVCASAATPDGWVERGTAWRPNRCGHPNNITQNVKLIQRVN